jgi:thiol-disulfide isomerase/thioredoxin
MKKLMSLLAMTLFLTSCSSGTSSNEESFVSGNGAVTWVKQSDRVDAPNISGTTLLGEKYALPNNTVAVINVWASWCSPCRAEEPTLSALAIKYKNVPFVGILTRDNPVNAEAFVRKRQSPYPTLINDSLLIGFRKSLPANAIPTTVVLDKNGKVAGRISGAVTVSSLSELIEKALSE